MPDGGVIAVTAENVSVARGEVAADIEGEFVALRVSDTGAGIPPDVLPKVFDPFFTTKEVGKGTGQGLSFSYTVVVKKHGGKIWFETEVGKGTTFFVTLPTNVASSAVSN